MGLAFNIFFVDVTRSNGILDHKSLSSFRMALGVPSSLSNKNLSKQISGGYTLLFDVSIKNNFKQPE